MTNATTQDPMRARQGAHVIHHVFEIAAPCEVVYAALTTPDALSSWWTRQVRAETTTVGAVITFGFNEQFSPRLRVAELDPNARVVWEGVGGHDAWGETAIRFDLDATKSGTRVRFWHHMGADRTDDAVAGANFRWGYYLDSLRLFCEIGAGHPFQADHASTRPWRL